MNEARVDGMKVAPEVEMRWRVVHAATGMEMFLAIQSAWNEPTVYTLGWRKAPGADFTRREATALGAAFIALTGDRRVSLEPVDNEG